MAKQVIGVKEGEEHVVSLRLDVKLEEVGEGGGGSKGSGSTITIALNRKAVAGWGFHRDCR